MNKSDISHITMFLMISRREKKRKNVTHIDQAIFGVAKSDLICPRSYLELLLNTLRPSLGRPPII